MNLKFRSKFNHGYLQSVVWKAFSDFNPIGDGPFFQSCSMTLGSYTLPKEYINNVKHHLSSDDICWHFFTKNQQLLLYQERHIQIAFEYIIPNSSNFFEAFKGFLINMVWILMVPVKLANCKLKYRHFSVKVMMSEFLSRAPPKEFYHVNQIIL